MSEQKKGLLRGKSNKAQIFYLNLSKIGFAVGLLLSLIAICKHFSV